jgi:hypothetical protein
VSRRSLRATRRSDRASCRTGPRPTCFLPAVPAPDQTPKGRIRRQSKNRFESSGVTILAIANKASIFEVTPRYVQQTRLAVIDPKQTRNFIFDASYFRSAT